MTDADARKAAEVVLLKEDSTDDWTEPSGDMYRCAVYLAPEDEGGYSVTVPSLPGAVSEGETEREALDNITEALAGLIESYKAKGDPIPWKNGELPAPEPGVITRWVFINA